MPPRRSYGLTPQVRPKRYYVFEYSFRKDLRVQTFGYAKLNEARGEFQASIESAYQDAAERGRTLESIGKVELVKILSDTTEEVIEKWSYRGEDQPIRQLWQEEQLGRSRMLVGDLTDTIHPTKGYEFDEDWENTLADIGEDE